MAGTRRRRQSRSQSSRWRAGTPRQRAHRIAQERDRLPRRAPRLGGVARQAPELDAAAAASSSRSQPCGGAITFDIREPSENGCAAKVTPPAAGDGGADLPLRPPRVGDLLVEPEHEQVPRLRRHLVADEQQHAAAPALLAAPAGLERVVIGEQHAVRARPRPPSRRARRRWRCRPSRSSARARRRRGRGARAGRPSASRQVAAGSGADRRRRTRRPRRRRARPARPPPRPPATARRSAAAPPSAV